MEYAIPDDQSCLSVSCSSIPPIVATCSLIIPREKARQNICKQFELLTFESEEAFSRLVMVASRAIRTSITALAFMGEKEHYLRAKLGFDASTIAREWSICTLTYLDEHSKAFVIPNTLEHPLTKDHLIVNNPPYIRCYAAANIFLDGVKVGTFCACDSTPRAFSERDVSLLIDMAACISELLTMRSRRWIQEHVNGISLSSAILSSIKTPLEDVGKDVDQFQDLVEQVECCSCSTTVASASSSHNYSLFDRQFISSATDLHHPIHSLTPCSSFTMSQSGRSTAPHAFSQDFSSFSANSVHTPTFTATCAPEQSVSTPFHTSRKRMSHSQKLNQSTYHSSSKSNNKESLNNNCNNMESVLEQLQIVADNLREDVKFLGQAIDLAIQHMLEISLRSTSTSTSLATSSLEAPFSPSLSLPNSSPDTSNHSRCLHRSFSRHNLYENEKEDQHNLNDQNKNNVMINDDDNSPHNDDHSQQQLMDIKEIFNTIASHSTSPICSPTASPSQHTHKTSLIITDPMKLTSNSRIGDNNGISTDNISINEDQSIPHHYHHNKKSNSHSHHLSHHRRHHFHRGAFTVPTIVTSFSHHQHHDNHSRNSDVKVSHDIMGVAELSDSIPSNNNGNNDDNITNNVDMSNNSHLNPSSHQPHSFGMLNQFVNPSNNSIHISNSNFGNNIGSLRCTNSGSSLLRYLSPRFNYNSRHIPRPEDEADHLYHRRHLRHNTDPNDIENPSLYSNIYGNANHDNHIYPTHQQYHYNLPHADPTRGDEITTRVATFSFNDTHSSSQFNSQDAASLAASNNLQSSLHR